MASRQGRPEPLFWDPQSTPVKTNLQRRPLEDMHENIVKGR